MGTFGRKMPRREMLRLAGGGAAAALARGAPASLEDTAHTSAGDRPNVLFIVLDDANHYVGCLGGHPDAETPNMDRLADSGVLFSKAYCPAPLCNPSRTSVLSGLRPSTSGIYLNVQRWQDSLPSGSTTIPQHFSDRGYRCLASGKIYHGYKGDVWDDYAPALPKPPEPPHTWPWGPYDATIEEMSDWSNARWIADRLGEAHVEPFFLAWGSYRPHGPWFAPRDIFERFDPATVSLPPMRPDDLDDVPDLGQRFARPLKFQRVYDAGVWGEGVAAYLATLVVADTCLGLILDALDQSPYRDNTIVVLWSDNGVHWGEKRAWDKGTLWEEATRTPLVIRAPGVTRAGGVCSEATSLLDIFPTLVELCALDPVDALEGIALTPWLEDPSATRRIPAITTHKRRNHAVRRGRWRYTRYRDGTEELYDQAADPHEWVNLASDAAYESKKRNLAAWLPQHNAPNVPFTRGPFLIRRGREITK